MKKPRDSLLHLRLNPSLGQKKDTELVLSYFRPNQIQKSSLHESRNCFIKKSYTCLLNGSLILQERKVLLSLTHSSSLFSRFS